jgi:hypothetical protein
MSIVRTSLKGRRLGLRGNSAWLNGMVDRRFAGLGYSYTAADYAPDQYSPYLNPSYSAYGTPAIAPSSSGLSPTDAALISQGIATAGKIGTQAIVGTPTVSFNPATGMYTATGGATLPSASVLGSTLSAYLPYLLLGGGVLLVVSMMGRR